MRELFYIQMIENIECLNEYVQVINNENRYWMVRTMGGSYYDEFVEEGFVAIGHNEFLLHNIRSLVEDDKLALRELRAKVVELYGNVERPGHIASQLLRFCRKISVGDILVIPSSSSEICICKVTGDVYEEVDARENNGRCPFMKRIPVTILEKTYRYLLPVKAQLMFNSRHPISDISGYAMYIDSMVSDYYNKDGETHIALKIDTDDDVSVSAFYAIQQLFNITEDFCRGNGIDGSANDVIMKVQMESKGSLHFISTKKSFLALVGLGILFINGGGLKIESGNFKLDLSTDGIFKKYDEHLDRNVDREIRVSIKNSLDQLKIKTPEDYKKAVIELYKTQNENREEY